VNDIRKIGTLYLRIGLVNIPLGINSFLDYQGLKFKQLCPTCNKPITYKRYCGNCKIDVSYSSLKSGLMITKDEIIVIDKDVFKDSSLETKILAIINSNSEYEFISEKFYLLTPDDKIRKPYFLLLNLLLNQKKSLVVEFMFRKKIHLGIIKPTMVKGVVFLMLKGILYADKIKEISLIEQEQLSEQEVNLGNELFKIISDNVENKNYDEIKDKRLEVLEKVLNGEVVKPIEVNQETELLEQLKSSVQLSQPKKKLKKGVKV